MRLSGKQGPAQRLPQRLERLLDQLAAFFISIVVAASVFELVRSYRTAFAVAFTEADLSGYLVAEWISESFSGIEYILQDILCGFDQQLMLSASRSAEENAGINQRLVRH